MPHNTLFVFTVINWNIELPLKKSLSKCSSEIDGATSLLFYRRQKSTRSKSLIITLLLSPIDDYAKDDGPGAV